MPECTAASILKPLLVCPDDEILFSTVVKPKHDLTVILTQSSSNDAPLRRTLYPIKYRSFFHFDQRKSPTFRPFSLGHLMRIFWSQITPPRGDQRVPLCQERDSWRVMSAWQNLFLSTLFMLIFLGTTLSGPFFLDVVQCTCRHPFK